MWKDLSAKNIIYRVVHYNVKNWYLYAPRLLGGFESQNVLDICSQTLGLSSAVLLQSPDVCTEKINNKIDGIAIVVVYIMAALLFLLIGKNLGNIYEFCKWVLNRSNERFEYLRKKEVRATAIIKAKETREAKMQLQFLCAVIYGFQKIRNLPERCRLITEAFQNAEETFNPTAKKLLQLETTGTRTAFKSITEGGEDITNE